MISQECRPKNFREVAGQNLSKKLLKSIIKNKEEAPHSIILQGSFGCGKTTMSRIFARALNCPNSKNQEPCLKDDCLVCQQDLDNSNFYVEYDSSIVGNVSKIRELRDTFYYVTKNTYKVIVLDECHLASSTAQSALLKVIEEAPKNVFFIFATTHINKLLPTIRSRSLEIRVETVAIKDIINNLKNICKVRNITIDDKTLELIASKSKGHMRNAHMLLDNYLLLGEEDFKTSLISSREALLQYLISIIKYDNELLFKSISLIETFPIANVYEDFQILLRDITRRMVEPKDDMETRLIKAMTPNKFLKFLKAFSSEYIKVSFQNEISATTALMALWQQFTTQHTSNTSSSSRVVRTK